MLWRLPRKVFDANKGEGNARALRELVRTGPPPGVLGFAAGTPVAWCSVAPRETFPALARSRVMRPVDDQPVWSISCLFVARTHRGRGLSVRAIAAATAYALAQGATIVEAYPSEPSSARLPAAFVWTGLAAAYRAAGFVEVARRSATRPIMRYHAPAQARGERAR